MEKSLYYKGGTDISTSVGLCKTVNIDIYECFIFRYDHSYIVAINYQSRECFLVPLKDFKNDFVALEKEVVL